MEVEGTSSSLYFSAAASIANAQAQKAQKDEKSQKTDKTRRKLFSSAMEKAREEFADYRKKVSQFLRYLAKNNFEVKKRERRGFTRKGKPLDPQFKIVVINQKLDEMANWLLSSHREAFAMLARVNEISGLLVDLMAS